MNHLKASDYLTREERRELIKKNDWKATQQVLMTWGIIAFSFALVYFYTNIFTILIALFLLGGRQLACSVIMHDTGHKAMFSKPQVNDFVGKWLGAYPILQDMLRYRHYHNEHHVHTGTAEDPDISLTKGYPTSFISMCRKIGRDLSGATGLKSNLGVLYMHLHYLTYNLGGRVERLIQKDRTWAAFFQLCYQNLSGPILANVLLYLLLWALGAGWLYWLWIGALFTTYNFSIRIRAIAEHSMVPDALDKKRNTRTTYANWLERLLFAPHHVNYHVEHHMLMSVPSYNLPRMHRLLKERGFYDEGILENSYWEVLKLAIGRKTVEKV